MPHPGATPRRPKDALRTSRRIPRRSGSGARSGQHSGLRRVPGDCLVREGVGWCWPDKESATLYTPRHGERLVAVDFWDDGYGCLQGLLMPQWVPTTDDESSYYSRLDQRASRPRATTIRTGTTTTILTGMTMTGRRRRGPPTACKSRPLRTRPVALRHLRGRSAGGGRVPGQRRPAPGARRRVPRSASSAAGMVAPPYLSRRYRDESWILRALRRAAEYRPAPTLRTRRRRGR